MIDCEKSGALARSRVDIAFQILESGVEGVDFFEFCLVCDLGVG